MKWVCTSWEKQTSWFGVILRTIGENLDRVSIIKCVSSLLRGGISHVTFIKWIIFIFHITPTIFIFSELLWDSKHFLKRHYDDIFSRFLNIQGKCFPPCSSCSILSETRDIFNFLGGKKIILKIIPSIWFQVNIQENLLNNTVI